MKLTAKRFRKLFRYNSRTGLFYRRKKPSGRGGRYRDDLMVGVLSKGYRLIGIDGRHYRAGRLAWLYVYGCWPSNIVDHKNGVFSDDRIANLREATAKTNGQNSKRYKNSFNGLKGVRPDRHKYQARIMVDGHRASLGYFDTAEMAHAAYRRAAKKYFGKFARMD
jgi:HNH endonuclease